MRREANPVVGGCSTTGEPDLEGEAGGEGLRLEEVEEGVEDPRGPSSGGEEGARALPLPSRREERAFAAESACCCCCWRCRSAREACARASCCCS